MDPVFDYHLLQTRRQFFGGAGLRVGGAALALLAGDSLVTSAARAATNERVHPAIAGLPHFAPKAKSLIYLHMNGGPSQLDTWDSTLR